MWLHHHENEFYNCDRDSEKLGQTCAWSTCWFIHFVISCCTNWNVNFRINRFGNVLTFKSCVCFLFCWCSARITLWSFVVFRFRRSWFLVTIKIFTTNQENFNSFPMCQLVAVNKRFCQNLSLECSFARMFLPTKFYNKIKSVVTNMNLVDHFIWQQNYKRI